MTKAKGIETLLEEPPVIDIMGKPVQLQHLGLKHSFIVMDMAKKILKGDNLTQLMNRKEGDKDNVELGIKILSDMLEDEKAISKFLAAVLGWTEEDVMDPNQLPIQYVPAVMEAFVQHPDLNSFIEQVKSKLGNLRLPALLN